MHGLEGVSAYQVRVLDAGWQRNCMPSCGRRDAEHLEWFEQQLADPGALAGRPAAGSGMRCLDSLRQSHKLLLDEHGFRLPPCFTAEGFGWGCIQNEGCSLISVAALNERSGSKA